MRATFCGNGKINYTSEDEQRLYEAVEELILQGYDEFYLGGYGKFDILAAKTVKKLKTKYNYIKSYLVIPYLNKEYNTDLYDETIYPPLENVPPKYAILKRNFWAVDEADALVSCVKYTCGGSAKTLEYAVKRNKKIIDLTKK